MARTFIRQEVQIAESRTYTDNLAAGVTLESGAANIEDDLNSLRSQIHRLLNNQAGNWYDDLTTPATFTGEGEAARGVDDLNADLHSLERKRVLREVHSLADVTVGAGDNFVVLGAGELPSNTTLAIGAVNTLGTVVAFHTGTFGTHSLDEVAGPNAIAPSNLMVIVDGSTRDPILSGSRKVYGLFQSESSTDGSTATTSTPNRLQISFVRVNAAGDDLEACPIADIESTTINFSSREQVAFDDLNKFDFLSGGVVDVPSSSTVNLQSAYDNQGATPVDLTANAILDLEGNALSWTIRDDTQANLFSVVEGSSGGTSQFNVHAAVDEYDNDAVSVDFASGATLNSGGTRPIAVGVSDGILATTSGDFEVRSAAELFLDDANQAGSTWAQTTGIKLSDTTAEWDTFETNFGEVSLLNAISQAFSGTQRTKVQAALTSDVTSTNDVNGPGTPHANTDVDLAPFDQVTFVSDVEVYLNGELLRNDAAAAGSNDVYPGGTPADGDLRFNFDLVGTGSKPDQITVVVNGQ